MNPNPNPNPNPTNPENENPRLLETHQGGAARPAPPVPAARLAIADGKWAVSLAALQHCHIITHASLDLTFCVI